MIYITFPHDKLKYRLFDIINSCFFSKNESRKNAYLVIGILKKYILFKTILIDKQVL